VNPAAADTSRNATFGIGPASAKGPDGRSSFNFEVTPGATVTDNLAVVNSSTTPLHLSVYATDVIPGSDGTANLPAAGVKPVEAGTWLALATPDRGASITLPGRTTLVLPLAIAIPKDAAPGDHSAGLIASLTSGATNKQGENVLVDQRIAVRAYFRVSGTLVPHLAVEDLHATYAQNLNPIGTGAVTVTYTIRNTGNVRLAGRQHVTFHGPFGSTVDATDLADIPLLVPGASVATTTRLDGIWPEIAGNLDVTVQATPAPGDVDGDLPPTEATTRVWTIPIMLIVVLLALGGAFEWRRRRRRRARLAAADARGPGGAGATSVAGDGSPDGEPADGDGPARDDKVGVS
jgi:hypothetical protein